MAPSQVLFLPAHPDNTPLQLGCLAEEISSALGATEYGNGLEFAYRWAVRGDDLRQILGELKPQIVHFCGHESHAEQLVLVDDTGNSRPASPSTLLRLFPVSDPRIRLVVLDACCAPPQADAVLQCVDFVVGVQRAMPGRGLFFGACYRALAFGRSIQEAIDAGNQALLLQGIARKHLPELRTRPGLVPSRETLTRPGRHAEPAVIPFTDATKRPGTVQPPVRLFYSYSHRDEALRDQLEKHLAPLQRQGILQAWHDGRIPAGRPWAGDIHAHLDEAHIILLLISADFLASDYCHVEMRRALERHQAGEAVVIPVILRSCDWQSTPLDQLQALPRDATPVTLWENVDAAFTDVVRGIHEVVRRLTRA